MNQSENRDQFSKNKKIKTAHVMTGKGNSERAFLEPAEKRDWRLLLGILINTVKYPMLYYVCVLLTSKAGLLIQQNLMKEQPGASEGNLFFLLGNILFLFVYNAILHRYGRSIRTECSLLRDFKMLYHNNRKGLKAKFARLAKRSKKIFSKDVTARRVGVQYLYHTLAGISLGIVFFGLFLLLKEPGAYINSFNECYIIRKGGDEYIGILTFVLVTPFIEELIYHAHNMTVLRRDFTLFRSSAMVTAVYVLFHFGKVIPSLFIPVIFLINLIYDRTQNTRGIADYVAGRSVKETLKSSGGKGNIISIKDRAGKTRHRKFAEKDVLNVEETSGCSLKEDINIETHMAEAVNDFNTNGIKDFDHTLKITDFYSERLVGSKPDITYSLLVNTGFHLSLAAGWIVLNCYGSEAGPLFSRQLLVFMVIISFFIIYKFIKKQHMFEF